MWQYLTPKDFETLIPYLQSAIQRGWKYYDLCVIDRMWCYNNQILFKIENDILYVSRLHRFINNLIHKMQFPPIHLYGDEEIEKQALLGALEIGVSVNATKQVAKDMGLKYTLMSQWDGGCEVVYTKEHLKMDGKKYARRRGELNKIKKMISNNQLTINLDNNIHSLYGLFETWKKQQGYKTGMYDYLLKNNEYHPYLKVFSVRSSDKIVFASVFLEIEKSTWFAPCSMTDFENTVNGFQRLSKLIVLDQQDELETIIEGGWVTEEIKRGKTAIPHDIWRIAKIISPKKLTKSEWESFKPQPNTYFGV